LKRITLFILILLSIFSPTTFAQEGQTYEVGNGLTITFPDTWKVNTYDNSHQVHYGFTLEAISPNGNPTLGIFLIENQYRNIDDIITEAQNNMSKLDTSLTLEDSHKLYIDNHETRFFLYSRIDRFQRKHYLFFYIVFNNQDYYQILGRYDKLESDRQTIDGIISSMKILR
jgi:hypothetical protein